MKKHWLRGVLLGASLVLLLAAGCGDKMCIECYDGPPIAAEGAMVPVPDEYTINFSARGIEDGEYCASLYQDGKLVRPGTQCDEPGEEEASGSFFVTCDDPTFFLFSDIHQPVSGQVPDYRGVWSLRVTKVGNSSNDFIEWLIEWLVADDCPEEFVPEPGTMVLMGSGLVGLAGYATLRWRRRK